MTLREIWQWWDKFWFAAESPLPVCLFRILLGIVMLEAELLKIPDWLNWYGEKGVYSMMTCQQYLGAPCINLLTFLPQTDTTVFVFMTIYLLALLCFTIGLGTRYATILTFLMVTTLDHRNPLILNGGDTVIRCCMFWMLFAPAGELLSLDRWLRKKRGENVEDEPLRSMWAWRLLQLQVVAVYIQCFWSKVFGTTWLDGTAVYYVLHEREYLRFPLPVDINNVWISKIFTWGALVIEFCMWSLIWIKELRYYVLAGGLALHLGLEYTMNLPVFEQVMICSFVLFIDPIDLRRVLGHFSLQASKIFTAKTALKKA